MLSKNKIKYIRSLELKKNRIENGTFVAEGNKLVSDILSKFECQFLAAKETWIAQQGNIPSEEIVEADEEDIRRASFLNNPQDVIAVFKLPQWKIEDVKPSEHLVLALDGIQNPGNLGTIIRLADWFGISHIVCSEDTADAFSPKVVQATMGSLAHVEVHYVSLDKYLKEQATKKVPLFGTFLDGEVIYNKELSNHGIIVMGNEGNGIRPEIASLIKERLYIPHAFNREAESLNVAIATAIICSEFLRRTI